jgi:hypothetical protein
LANPFQPNEIDLWASGACTILFRRKTGGYHRADRVT